MKTYRFDVQFVDLCKMSVKSRNLWLLDTYN